MDVRNVQRTGNMHYIYLPTSWCKKYGIKSDSKIMLDSNNDGSLLISPVMRKKELKVIDITIDEEDEDILTMLIMACYLNPTQSFRIRLSHELDIARLLDKKNAISGFEFVEFDGHSITYESSMSINDPESLLKTMVKKIRNLVTIMINDYNPSLVNKYEEEIDRSKLLIDKAVTEVLMLNEQTKLKTIELHYISLISQHFERMVDFLIKLEKKNKTFLRELLSIIDEMNHIVLNISTMDFKKIVALIKKVLKLKQDGMDNIEQYNRNIIRNNLMNASEIFLDWSITKEIDK